MQACPYDALYINDATGTAEKCHFCAHRTERGLAPACAVVCPTEAIIPGDFHDPESVVSKMSATGELVARKTEAGTGPNVHYREVDPAGVDPLKTNMAGGFIWSQSPTGPQVAAHEFEAMEKKAEARTVYDVAHPSPWGNKVSTYLFTKSLAAGAMLAAILGFGQLTASVHRFAVIAAIVGLLVTTILLVADLKRPGRFLYILKNPNWDSWITRGTVVLMAYGGLLVVCLAESFVPIFRETANPGLYALGGLTALAAAGTAAYTAWLFGQAKGRPLWMMRGLAAHLVGQAVVAGCSLLLIAQVIGGAAPAPHLLLGLKVALALHLLFVLAEGALAPAGREKEYRRAAALLTRGPYARRNWGGLVITVVVPVALLQLSAPVFVVIAALFALGGLFLYEDTYVRAGQALPIS